VSEDAAIDMSAALDADAAEALNIALDAYEGPLHALLDLARAKKIDIAHISVSEIADQYIAFIAEARARNMEIAGDYLVMASWLTLLKSRLLIPKPTPAAAEPDAQTMEDALRRKLARLAATRENAKRLGELPQLDCDVFLNGQPQAVQLTEAARWQTDLYELLKAYCGERSRVARRRAYRTFVRRAFPLEAARRSLERALGGLTDWRTIEALTPVDRDNGPGAPPRESYLASTFGASLELAREHRLELRQEAPFADLYMRARAQEADAQEVEE